MTGAEPWDEVPAGPPGGAFLELARLEEVEPGLAASPDWALPAAANALNLVQPWSSLRGRILDRVRQHTARHRDLLRRIVDTGRAGWWFAPLERDRQELLRLPASGGRPSLGSLRRGPPWVLNESAQRPRRAVITATPRAGLNPELLTRILEDGGTLERYETQRARVAPDAEVVEIRTAADWQALCRAFPHRPEHARSYEVSVDWNAAARRLGEPIEEREVGDALGRVSSGIRFMEAGGWYGTTR